MSEPLPPSRLSLGVFPTPVVRMAGVWVKRDDLASDLYGGNKVRKLELLLDAARRSGRSRLLTIGAAGSHQVVATAIFGRREGFSVDAVVVPQPKGPHTELNLRVALAQGAIVHPCPAWGLMPAYVARHLGRDCTFIPLGGSSPLGAQGFVSAAHELYAQVQAGELPEPDVLVVAAGSGGTAAGLAVGLEQLGMKTRVLGAAVSPPARVVRHLCRRLAQKTATAAGLSSAVGASAARRLEIDGAWIGRGYGHSTDEGQRASEVAAREGLTLDVTYTSKAFACALACAQRGDMGNVLYWHTLSSAPLEPLLGHAPAPLPENFARLFK